MSNLNVVFPNRKLLDIHFKTNWKIILFYTFFWTFLSGMIILLGIKYKTIHFSRGIYIYPENDSSGFTNFNGLSNVISQLQLGIVGFIFFGIVSMSCIYLVFLKELSNGKINFWMTTGLSRNNIFLSKIYFVFIEIMIIYFPGIILTIFVSCFADDISSYLGYLIYASINFMLLTFLIFIFLLFISVCVIEQNYLWVIVCGLIICYIITTQILNTLYNISPQRYEWAKNTKYFSIQSLMYSVISYDLNVDILNYDDQGNIIKPSNCNIVNYPFIKPLLYWEILSPILLIVLIVLFIYFIIWILNKKDLNI